ncbi:uncharacterized protein LOC122639053 [Telopea speciosissima]|uniref:uncharacterized protein LOC122639053 n=1 Tax=Telopea speciosissima TaxID=54955 RepID=UPI001CC727CE|nr:uncharacterized protein LOC122639053 [Telopea speciosissima]
MGSYRKAKLVVDAFRGFASRIVTRAPIGEASQGFKRQPHSSIFRTGNARTFGLSGSSLISWRTNLQIGGKQSHHLPFLGGGKRFYYVDRYRVQHFRPRGPNRCFQKPRIVLVVVLVSSAVLITVYFGSLETIPYTKRNHFVLLPKRIEKQIGETQFQQLKAEFKGKILPAIHPERVQLQMPLLHLTDNQLGIFQSPKPSFYVPLWFVFGILGI